jgi:hypothetical protein
VRSELPRPLGHAADRRRFCAADILFAAWVLDNPRPLKKPLPYQHPSGAIIWVKLDGTVAQSDGTNSDQTSTARDLAVDCQFFEFAVEAEAG